MRILLQRVKNARVTVGGEVVGEIGKGILVFVGIHKDDVAENIPWFVHKIVDLRIFPDEKNKMNLSLKDVNGDVLIVSQFTLYCNCLEGRRPSFDDSAPPDRAETLYEIFVQEMKSACEGFQNKVATGKFRHHMQVELVNDGPATFLIEKENS